MYKCKIFLICHHNFTLQNSIVKNYKISVSVMYNGAELNEYIDYEIDYENYENAGTAKFTINLIGNYSGTITKTYKINKFDIFGLKFNRAMGIN